MCLLLLWGLCAGGDWADFNPVSTWPRRKRQGLYGANVLQVVPPSITNLLFAQLSDPMLVIPVSAACAPFQAQEM